MYGDRTGCKRTGCKGTVSPCAPSFKRRMKHRLKLWYKDRSSEQRSVSVTPSNQETMVPSALDDVASNIYQALARGQCTPAGVAMGFPTPWAFTLATTGRGLHSSTSQLNLSRV